MEDLTGTVVRGYELKNLLGAGGFGAVYRAYQPSVKRNVALKVILPEFANHPDFIRRFEAEAQIIARLEHLHIVPLYDFWREPDGAYLVMRLLHGSLRGLVQKEPLNLEQTADIVDQISAALSVAHRNGIVHRDIKPDNILLDEEGNAYLTDFGIAKDLQEDTDEDDLDDELTGSPHYISPEQAQQEQVSGQSDIYSLGIVVFEMLTGSAPFAGNTTMMELILKQINEPLPPIQTLNPDLPEDIDWVIQRATDKNPDARYPDVISFAIAFRQAIPGISMGRSTMEIPAMDGVDTEPTVRLVVPSIENPYKGLRPFEEADADDFFGRDELVQRLLGRVAENRFLAVIGPSGSGKSSAVKAGLLPAIRQGDIPGSNRWYLTEMVPGNNPFQELESALLSVAVGGHSNLQYRLLEDDSGLLNTVESILPSANAELVLVIDQFEEVFTQVPQEEVRTAFLNSIMVAAQAPHSRLRVIITMRADFYDRPLLYPGFGEMIRRYSEVVLPLSNEEMEAAITGPADRAGLDVETGLISAIIAEVSEQPGALPLLQYALTEVFERRDGNKLTLAAYQQTGGVLGALARRAEELYVQISEAEQEATRQMFLRLVTLGEGTEDTRRRVLVGELLSAAEDEAAAQSVLDLYSKYRLFTFDHDPVTRDPTVEVAHEALIREWQRLREWLDDNRDDVRVQQRLSFAAQEWVKQGRDPSFLASGLRLQQFETLLEAGNLALSAEEAEYTRASLEERNRREAEEEARRQRELQLERRARRRLQAFVGVFIAATIIASILALLALQARAEAQDNEEKAQENEATAVAESFLRATAQSEAEAQRNQALLDASRVLSILALNQLQTDPVASINLALRALPSESDPRPYTAQAEFALAEAVKSSMERAFFEPESGIIDVAFGDDTIAIAGQETADRDGTDVPQGVVVLTDYNLTENTVLKGHAEGATIGGLDHSDNGQLLSYDTAAVYVWDGDSVGATLPAEAESRIFCAKWQPGGDQIAVCMENTISIWNPADASTISLRPLQSVTLPDKTLWSPDGQKLVYWDDTMLVIWDGEGTTAFEDVPAGHTIETVALDNNGIVIAFSNNDIVYVDDETTSLTGHTALIDGIRFLDDERLLSFGDDGAVIVWNVDGEVIHTMGPMASEVNGVALSPNNTMVLVWLNDGTAQVWDITTGTLIASLSGQERNILNAVWRDDNHIATTDVSFSIRIWKISDNTTTLLTTLYGHSNRVEAMRWLDPDHLLSYSQDDTMRVWKVFDENGNVEGDGLELALTDHETPLDYAAWIDDNTIVSSDRTTARHWTVDTGESIVIVDEECGRRCRFIWKPDGSQVLVYSDNAGGRVWDIATQTVSFDVQGPIATLSAFWLDIGIIISDRDGVVTWIDNDGAVMATLEGHTGQINDARFVSQDRRLATVGSDNFTLIWELPTTAVSDPLQPAQRLDHDNRPPLRVTWHSDGVRLLSVGFNGDVSLWNTRTGEGELFLTADRRFPGRNRAQFSPNEQMFAAPVGNSLFVWDMDSNLILRHDEDNAIQGVEWVMQGERSRLLLWGSNGVIRVLDMPSGTEVLRFNDERTMVAAFNSDRSRILSAGSSTNILIWQAWPDLQELINTAYNCCRTRPLSAEQQQAFNIED